MDKSMVAQDHAPRPRILVVSRRHMRKNKLVDIVGEYHLDLIVKYGGVPVIVPRVQQMSGCLDAFEPFHGVLLCEGEDISPKFRQSLAKWCSAKSGGEEKLQTANGTERLDEDDEAGLDSALAAEVAAKHPSDTNVDIEKDNIEFELLRRCLRRGIPFLGICRGSQILNVAAGGSLYNDLSHEVPNAVAHIDYDNYDAHRHPIEIVPGTPLSTWFDGASTLNVSSYHHQGVKRLAPRFKVMARSPDGLVEAFYDPDTYDPSAGKYMVGLQFHPERMQRPREPSASKMCLGERTEQQLEAASEAEPDMQYEYPGCPRAYEAFVRAARSRQLLRRLQQMRAHGQRQLHDLGGSNGRSTNGATTHSRDVRRTLDASGVTVRGGRAYANSGPGASVVTRPRVHKGAADPADEGVSDECYHRALLAVYEVMKASGQDSEKRANFVLDLMKVVGRTRA